MMRKVVKGTVFLAVFTAILFLYSSSCSLISSEDHQAITSLDDNISLFRGEISRLNDNLEDIKHNNLVGDLALLGQRIEQLQLEIYQLRSSDKIQQYMEELKKLNIRLEDLDELSTNTGELAAFLKENEDALRSIADYIDELRNPYGSTEED